MSINYNPSRHVAGAVVAAVAAAGLLDDVAPGEDCFYGEDAKNLPARVAVVVAVEAVADVLPPGMAMTGTAVTDGNGVDGSAAGAGGVAVGPRLGPVDAGIPVDWVPVAEYCAKKKITLGARRTGRHNAIWCTREGSTDDCESTTNLLKVY